MIKKQLLGILSIALISTFLLDGPSSQSVKASSITPLVFGSSMSAVPNMDDFVASGYFDQTHSNLKYPSPPFLMNWQGTQTMHLMPAGHTIKHNSLFLKNKVDISRSERKGISTFMEFSLHKGEHQWAGDGFSLVLARDDFRTKERAGYATGSINNSVAIRFSTWRPHPINSTGLQVSVAKNGNTTDAALIGDYQNIDVELGTISPWVGAYGLLRIYKMWIDLDAATGNLEIRVRFDNSFVRPELPTVTYSNISMADLTDQFYAGITISGGGLTLGLFLNHMYAANQYLPGGIDMTNLSQYMVDKTSPTAPSVSPLRTETGYTLSPTSTDNAGGNIFYEYKLDNAAYAPATMDTEIPFGTRQVLIRAFDSVSNISTITTVNFIKVTYHDPFGVTLQEQWYPTSHPLELLTPTRPGYTFAGWYSEDTLVNEVTQLSTSVDSMLYPKWIANPYTIQFQTNGGSEVEALTQRFATNITSPVTPTKLGHTFAGWFADETLTTPYVFSTMPMNDITLYAKWLVNSYTVRYETFGGNVLNDAQVSFGNQVTSAPTPTKARAFFDGWYMDSALTQPFAAFAMPAVDVTLYAAWIDATPVENLIDMVEAWPDPLDLSYAQSLLDAKSLLASLSTKQNAYVPDDIRQTIERADIHIHNLTVVQDTEALFDDLPNPVTTADIEFVKTIRQRYDALNNDQKNLFNSSLLQRLIIAEATIAIPYVITFQTNGGSEVEALTQRFATNITSPVTPTKLGHTFAGWFADETLTTPYVFSTMPMNDITLYAKWLVNSYTVRYETFGGNVLNDAQVSFGNQVTSAPTPTKARAFFDGWYMDSALTQPFAAFAMPAVDVTLYAAWIDATPVENLIDMVEAWPDPLDLSYAQSLLDAKSLLASLSTKQNAYVPDDIRQTIERADIHIHNLTVVQDLIDQINDLSVSDMNDVNRVNQARRAYDNLTPEQQMLIGDNFVEKLIEYERQAVLFVERVNYRTTSFSILIFHLSAGAGLGLAFHFKRKKEIGLG